MNIIGRRKFFYALSLIIIGAGLLGLIFNHGLNLGIDFRSGTIIEVDLRQSATTEQLREVLNPFDLGSTNIRAIGTNGAEYEIKTATLDEMKLTSVMAGIRSKWPEVVAQVPATVAPAFSAGLVKQALWALLISFVGIVLYITWRFEFKFAISAIIALVHDVLVVIGFFAIFRIEVNSEFIAALLTIIGFSINDTIVIFDRIRENLGSAKKIGNLEKLANDSILQTMSRSLRTSTTTLLATSSILVFGGVTLRPLTTALVVGMISGVYSTVFVASSIWVDWKQKTLSKQA